MGIVEKGIFFAADKGGTGGGKVKPDIGAQQAAMGAAAHEQASSYVGESRPQTENPPGGFANQGTQQAIMGAAASGGGAKDNKN